MHARLCLVLSLTGLALATPLDWVFRSQDASVYQSSVPASNGRDWEQSGWADPRINGGRMLDYTLPHLGEPINIIISGKSDPWILTPRGLHMYSKSLGFSEECLGLHVGNIHDADLGDGDGRKGEHFLARQHYFPIWGTCWESLVGGNHFRAWRQNGTLADSGAWFLAASKEKYIGEHHTIADNGYNIGRDLIVTRAAAGSRWQTMWWTADVEWVEGLLEPGSGGINHNITQDGRVAVLTVRRL